jgi:hypothetical protein
MGMMGASMAGSLAGNAISHAMFGNNSNPSPQQQQEVVQAVNQGQVPASDPCKTQFDMYAKCMDNSENCQWAWDEIAKCRTSNNL